MSDCRLCRTLESLDRDDRETLDALVEQVRDRPPGDRDPSKPGIQTIEMTMRLAGLPCSKFGIRKHVVGCR